MSSSSERNTGFPKSILLSEQASHDRPSQKSNPDMGMSPSKPSRGLPPFLGAASTSSSSLAVSEWMMMSSCGAQARRGPNSSTPKSFSTPSTKRTKYDTAVPAGQKPWIVKLHRQVGKEVAGYGLADRRFSPSLRELIDALSANPKQFPRKKGKLKDARAAGLKFEKVTFRAVFTLDEAARLVLVLSLDPHDVAYDRATRRVRSTAG